MKNIIFTFIAIVATMFATSCQKEWSEEIAAAQHEAVVNEWHVAPVDGIFGNAEVQFRCLDSFTVDFRGQHYEASHYCHSTYRIFGGDVEANVESLNGCYNVEADGTIANTNLYLTFVEDKVESALVNIAGIPDPVDYSNRFRPCHYEPYQICFDTEAKKIRVYGVNKEEGDTAVASGDWYGVIVHNDTTVVVEYDTVILRDTIITHDTIHHHDTIIFHDTIVRNDTVITTRTTQATTEHISWNPTAVMQGGYLCVYGTDRLTVVVFENGVQVSSNSTTYQHRTRYAVTGIAGLTLPSGTNTCVNIVNGQLTINGNVITTTFVDDVITDAAVVVNGVNYKSQLTPCHATAVKWCFNNGNAVCHFDDANTTDIATYTTTYTTEIPTTPLFPNAVGAWASDEYTTAVVTSMSQRITNVIVIEQVGSNYKYFRGVLTAGMTRADFDSVSITATEYTWLMGKIAAGYVPAIVADHNSTAEYRGAVKSEDQSSYWKLTYDIQAGTAYVMSQSAWTISGYNGRNANRGVMNATTGKLVADGITLQVR